MQLGLDSYSYHLAFGAHPDFSPRRKMTLFDFIARVAELGLDGLQIDPMHLASRDLGYLAEIRAAAQEKNLFIEHGAMGLDLVYLRGELAIATQLGSPILRTFAGFDRYASGVSVAAEIRRAITHLKRLRRAAEGAGIRIAIENHGDLTTDELVRIVREVDSPWVGICLDVGNSLLTLEDPLPAIRKMAPLAVTTHFKDYAVEMTNYGGKITGVALGDGGIDLAEAMALLRAHSNLDRIVLEIPIEARGNSRQALAHEDDCVRRSVHYARTRLGGLAGEWSERVES